ncbi:MAG: ribosome assembly cofactor RimP [Jejuia sp.]
MFKAKVQSLLDSALEERSDLFLIDFDVNEANHIKVILDGDNGVLVEDCMFVSRAIEHNLDREEQDFSLEVMSAGATSPLVNKRQYKRHISRTLAVKTDTEKLEGILAEASEDTIRLEWKARESKPLGKGKVTVKKQADVAYKDIVEAKVMIKF